MSRMRRVTSLALVAALAAGLTGCSFLGDLAEGQRITTERLGVDNALRTLVGELNGLEQVASASYHFDAVDPTTAPGVEVTLTTLDGDDWTEVASVIQATADDDALDGYPVAVQLTAGAVTSSFDTQYGLDWIDAETMAVVQCGVELFPEARVEVSGASASASFVSISVDDPAEALLDRMTTDPEVRGLIDGTDPSRIFLSFGAPGLSIAGTGSADAAAWVTRVLAVDLPRPAVGNAYPSAWVQVSLSGLAGDLMLGVELVGADDLATGPAWDALIAILTSPAPEVNGPGTCTPLQVMYAWPGVQGNFPSFVTECAEWGGNGMDPDRPSLVDLREALAASDIDLDALGFTLS